MYPEHLKKENCVYDLSKRKTTTTSTDTTKKLIYRLTGHF